MMVEVVLGKGGMWSHGESGWKGDENRRKEEKMRMCVCVCMFIVYVYVLCVCVRAHTYFRLFISGYITKNHTREMKIYTASSIPPRTYLFGEWRIFCFFFFYWFFSLIFFLSNEEMCRDWREISVWGAQYSLKLRFNPRFAVFGFFFVFFFYCLYNVFSFGEDRYPFYYHI